MNDAGTVIGYTDQGATIWRKNSSGAYETSLIGSLIANSSGWSNLNLHAINEAGQISGDGSFNGQGRGFILTPGPSLVLTLRTDADRSGTTDFDTPSDATAPGRPFYFWTNDDFDDADPSGTEQASGAFDAADGLISRFGKPRDLEDFARLAVKLTPDLQAALASGATLALEARGAGRLHLFPTPYDENELRYLTDEAFASSLVTTGNTNTALSPEASSDGVTTWDNLEARVTSADWDRGRLSFLWEGTIPGACLLSLKLTMSDGTTLNSDPVHISLYPVRDYFERVVALPLDGFPPPWDTNDQTPAMT